MNSFALPVPSAVGSLESYVQTINRFPLLTQEQEVAFAAATATRGTSRRRGSSSFLLRVVVAISRGTWVTACRRPT